MILSIDSSGALLSAIVAAFVGGLRNDPGLDDGYVSLSVRTSHIVLKTKCIDRVVALGPRGGKFATGTWLQAEGSVAEVPGVW